MSDDRFDDGLVHGHAWASAAAHVRPEPKRASEPKLVRVPSTVVYDDFIFCD